MEGLQALGASVFLLFALIFGIVLWEVEWVFPSSFKEGIIQVDNLTIYECKLTDKSKDMIKRNEELNRLMGKK